MKSPIKLQEMQPCPTKDRNSFKNIPDLKVKIIFTSADVSQNLAYKSVRRFFAIDEQSKGGSLYQKSFG